MRNIKLKIKLLFLSLKFSYLQDTSHFGNTVGGILSTLMFTASFLIFINVIVNKFPIIAGYSKDEIIFVALVSQIAFYLLYLLPWRNYPDFVSSVRDGSLDYLLTKPIPHLWYISFKNISLLGIATQGIPTLLILIFTINWANINISSINVLYGILTFVFGQIVLDSLSFLFTLPVFWVGASDRIFRILKDSIESKVPFEGYNTTLQYILTTFFPILILNVVPASVFLGKSNSLYLTIFSFVIAIIFTIWKILGWNLAIRNYSSVSS